MSARITRNSQRESAVSNLGEDPVHQLHVMLDGAAPLPASDAFGPCFERISQLMHRYELGFAPPC